MSLGGFDKKDVREIKKAASELREILLVEAETRHTYEVVCAIGMELLLYCRNTKRICIFKVVPVR
jgi:hypothetical protein